MNGSINANSRASYSVMHSGQHKDVISDFETDTCSSHCVLGSVAVLAWHFFGGHGLMASASL